MGSFCGICDAMGKKEGKKRKAESQNITESDNSSAGNNSSFVSDFIHGLSGAISGANRAIYGTPPGTNPTTSTPLPSDKVGHDSNHDIQAQLHRQQEQLQETSNKLDTIITKLGKLDEIEHKLSRIESDVTAVKERVTKVEKKTNELENSVSFLSDTVDEIKKDDSVVKLNEKVTGFENKGCNLEASVASVTGKVSELQEKLNNISISVDHGNTKINRDVRRHEQTIQTMCSSMDKLRREKRELEERVTELKWRSMKNNLIFHGLEGESRQEDVQSKLRSFIRQELGIDRFIEFGNVHRFGRHTRNKPRPIVAKFIYYQDRALVLENSYKLRNSQWRIYEQFPVAMEERRKQLQPVARDFRANGHHTKFVRDKLFIDGVLYDEEDCEQHTGIFKGFGYSSRLWLQF